MFCIKCGKPISDDSRFCTSCGNPVQDTTPVAPVSEPTPAPAPTSVSEAVTEPAPAPKAQAQVDEFGVPVAPKAAAPKVAPVVDEFGVPVYSSAKTTVFTAKPVNKKLLLGIIAAVVVIAIVVVLVLALAGKSSEGDKSSKEAVIEAAMKAACKGDTDAIIDLMPPETKEMADMYELREDIMYVIEDYVGFTYKSSTLRLIRDQSDYLESINAMSYTQYDECILVTTSVWLAYGGDEGEVNFEFVLLRDGDTWYLAEFDS